MKCLTIFLSNIYLLENKLHPKVSDILQVCWCWQPFSDFVSDRHFVQQLALSFTSLLLTTLQYRVQVVLTYGEHAISGGTIGAVLFENTLTHVEQNTVVILVGAGFVVPNIVMAGFWHDSTLALPYAALQC